MDIQSMVNRQVTLNVIHAKSILVRCSNPVTRNHLFSLLNDLEDVLGEKDVDLGPTEFDLSMMIVEELLEAEKESPDFSFNFEEGQD